MKDITFLLILKMLRRQTASPQFASDCAMALLRIMIQGALAAPSVLFQASRPVTLERLPRGFLGLVL